MRIPPLNVILSWPKPNYVDPQTRGSAVLVVNITFTALALIAVAGRFYVRLGMTHWFGADDWMMIPAVLCSVCMSTAVCLANLRYGWDRHLWDLPSSWYEDANLMAFIAKLAFIGASTFTRLSLLCLYYRLIKDTFNTKFKRVVHASVVWTTAIGITFVCFAIWLCSPIRCYWTWPPLEHCKCLNEGKVLLGGGVANCMTDALVTLLPIPIVMRLHLPLKQRLGISCLLGMGVLVTIAGAFRTYYTWKGLIDSWDETWWSDPLWISAAIEIDLAVICACAPTWKTLLQTASQQAASRLRSRVFSSNEAHSQYQTPAPGLLRSIHWIPLERMQFNALPSTSGSGNGSYRHTPGNMDLLQKPSRARLNRAHNDSDNSFACITASTWTHDSEVDAERSGDRASASPPSPPPPPPANLALEIRMRQSFDQTSAHISALRRL